MESEESALKKLHRCKIAATSLYGTDSPSRYCFSHSGTEIVHVTKDLSKFFEHTLHEYDMSVASLQSTLQAGPASWTQFVDTFCELNGHMPGSQQSMMMSKGKVEPEISILHQDWQGCFVQGALYQEFGQELESDGGRGTVNLLLCFTRLRCGTTPRYAYHKVSLKEESREHVHIQVLTTPFNF